MLEVTGLHERYGDLVAVEEVSFVARPGEMVGLLGPNGAGKTTTVSMIAGLLAPDRGEVRIEGGVVRGETDPVKLRLGLVPQDTGGDARHRHPGDPDPGDAGRELGTGVHLPAVAAESELRGADALGGGWAGRDGVARFRLRRRAGADRRTPRLRGGVRRDRRMALPLGVGRVVPSASLAGGPRGYPACPTRRGCLPRVGSHPTGVDLDGADLAAVEVHRAGEAEAALGHVLATDDVDHADDPVSAVGIVVDASIQEFHPAPGEAGAGLPADRILADADGLLGGETAGRTIGTAVAVAVAVAVCHGVDLNGADLAVVEVHRAGEAETLLTIRAAEDIDHTDDPVIAAGIVVDAGIEELDAAPAEALSRLPADRILAFVDGLFGGEAAGCAVLGASVAVDCAVNGAADGAADSGVVAAARGTGVVATTPNEVEGVAFGSALGIFNVDDGHSAVARIADQLLPAAAIDACKAKLGRADGQRSAALEAAPLRRAARDIPDGSLVAADLDIRDPVDYHFDGALTAVAAATGDHGGAALVLLRTRYRRHHEDCCEYGE